MGGGGCRAKGGRIFGFFIAGIVGGMQGNVRIVQADRGVLRLGYPMGSGIVQGNISRILESK